MRHSAAACALLALLPRAVTAQRLAWDVDASTGSYALTFDTQAWLSSPAAAETLCVGGSPQALAVKSVDATAAGTDAFGAWTGTTVTLATQTSPPVIVTHTFKAYSASPGILVATASFPEGVDTSSPTSCGGVDSIRTLFPVFNHSDATTASLGFLSWRGAALSTTAASIGLGNLGQNSLDSGPVVAFVPSPMPGVPHGALVWSSLDAHKIITQVTTGGGGGGSGGAPITSLWSPSRADQLSCATAFCTQEQVADGRYVVQRVEGYALPSASPACYNGAPVTLAPLVFDWSAERSDNVVYPTEGPFARSAPDATYKRIGDNGFVLTDATVPGTVPLRAFTRVYNASHTDWAALASAEGLAWAAANGYTAGAVLGYVFTSDPIPCADSRAGTYAMGLSAAVPSIPAGWSYSVVFSASYGGPTAATYAWGAAMQSYKGTTRLPSVTLSDIGYYTDDGAYYYVWEAFNIPARPWPAEVGMLLVKEDLYSRGVPVAYMQLDDWWYVGKFYFGNVKSVSDWHASNASRLFPGGLPAFADRLNISLQLYTPFWADDYVTPYNMTESTAFKGTKLVTPADSHAFFTDLFAFGNAQTGNRFKAYEIDFLLSNFQGSASMFETVFAADQWYGGMADAALASGIAIQYCLCSPTDMLQSLSHPSVVQARASGDYVNKETNPSALGGSSLLMGAVSIAPSKDTLWTSSPQPGTMSDTEHDGLSYTTQPHVALDAILATLSLGPVGISDGLGQVDVGLISQAFRSKTDSTLLRPSRPLSWVDSVLLNKTHGLPFSDIRSTHALLKSGPTSHYVLAWASGVDVTLKPTDLYPPPSQDAPLAVRTHIVAPAGAAQQAGCVDGAPAVPACISLLPAGLSPTIPASGTGIGNLTFVAVHEPLSNGAFFLGELTKFIHVSPQRFDSVVVGGGGATGIIITVRGTAGESILLTAVDASGTVHTATALIGAGGTVTVNM